MSTTHGQPGLSSEQRSTIRSTILSTRHTLEDELRRQLERYGIYENKRLSLEDLSHLSAEDRHTRRTLDAAIERELESTEGDLKRSITNYVREATKTYLNRFVALKTIEIRGLVEETITERPEYGNRSYMHHTVAEIAGELTNAPDDGFDAALDLAYQEIGAEIRMIFEESEHTAIDLDAQVREEVLHDLDAIDDDAWKSDEALGWVYQYFGEEEREEIDERVDKENYKIAGTDIATKTQLFTPRYIVKWMVDNSLGRLWLEMQDGRSSINNEDNCFYLAPLEDSLTDRETKPVKDITVLDPACGSGHMLFYAFDVLYQMYLEESEVPEKYIPREILRNNLYGVDIDSGAAQIAALSLYLKAKDQSPDVEIPQLNIVSADAVLINGERKEEILQRAGSELEREILEQIWSSFGDIRELGSLVQVEDRIDEVLDEYREEFEATGQAQFTTGGGLTSQSTFVAGDEEESWDEIKSRLIQSVQDLASEALQHNDPIEEMFAAEVGKTVELLEVLMGEYDTVVSNPPYLQSKKMGETLKNYIRDHYVGKYDVYGAFIERCLSFSSEDGHVSMVTPENFMFLYYFRGLRKKLLNESYFIEAAHLSGHSFSMKDRPFTIPFVLRGSTPDDGQHSRFYRMTHEQEHYKNYERKIAGLQEISEALRSGEEHNDVYVFSQSRIDDIGRRPFLYWFGEELLSVFSEYKSLGDIGAVKKGLGTGNNDKYIRKYWELNNRVEDNYLKLQKSGTDRPYYDIPVDYVYWKDNGRSIKNESNSYVRSDEFYFTEGINYRGFGNEFTARKHPSDAIFEDMNRYVHCEEISDEALLAILNSSVIRYLMSGLNPSIHFQVGDGERAPINTEIDENRISSLTSSIVEKQTLRSSLNDLTSDFDPELFEVAISEEGPIGLIFEREQYVAEVLVLDSKLDQLVLQEYDLSKKVIERIQPEERRKHADVPLLAGYLESSLDSMSLSQRDISQEEMEMVESALSNIGTDELGEVSSENEVSPISSVAIRKEKFLYTDSQIERAIADFMSYSLGKYFERWTDKPRSSSVNEIFDISTGGQFLEEIEEVLQIISGGSWGVEQIEEHIATSLADWVRDRYFGQFHAKKYRRRGQRIPIYWQLESPNGGFSCYVYYHGIDSNTLPKLRGQYLDPRIGELENELETLNAQTSGDNPDKELLKRKEEVQNDLDDIREFRDTIDGMIDDGVTVDVEKGIWENIKEWDQYEVLETGLPKLKSSYSR